MSSAGNLTPPDNDTSTPSMPAIDQAILLFHAIIFLLALVGNGLVSLSQRRHTHTVMPRHIVLSRHTVLQCRTVLFRHAILSCRTVMSCSLVILCSRVMSYSHVIQSCHTVMSHRQALVERIAMRMGDEIYISIVVDNYTIPGDTCPVKYQCYVQISVPQTLQAPDQT